MFAAAPPFFPNQEDANHCLQAALLMVLAMLGHSLDWQAVEEVSSYEDGLWTWILTAAAGINKLVPETRVIGLMDYGQFAARGEEYFREFNMNKLGWFENQKRHASPGFKKEQDAAIILVTSGLCEQRVPTLQEIETLLADHLVIAIVDGRLLAGGVSSYGHYVVVYATDGDYFLLHDPGPPPLQSWRVHKATFMGAFQNELMAIPRGAALKGDGQN